MHKSKSLTVSYATENVVECAYHDNAENYSQENTMKIPIHIEEEKNESMKQHSSISNKLALTLLLCPVSSVQTGTLHFDSYSFEF